MSEAMKHTLATVVLGAIALLQLVNYFQLRRRFGKLDRRVSRALASSQQNAKLLRAIGPSVTKLIGTDVKPPILAIEKRLGLQQEALDDLPSHLGYLLSLTSLTSAYPVFIGEASLDAFTLRTLVDRIERQRPKVILELGSGSSTMIIASILDRLGMSDVRHISVDHDEFYLGATQRNFARHGFRTKTEFWLCPLEADGEGEIPWYGGLMTRLGSTPLDLILVDGPPASFHAHARSPALPKLEALMTPGSALILDDASREDERQIIRDWRQAFPAMKVNIGHRGKGLAVFNKPGADVSPTS